MKRTPSIAVVGLSMLAAASSASAANFTVNPMQVVLSPTVRSAVVTIHNTSTQELPIDGNNIVNLTGLLPGVTSINAPATFTNDRQGPTYSASGSRVAQTMSRM